MDLRPTNPRLLALRESATVALADHVRRLVASGVSVTALQTGDPDAATPPAIIDAAARSLAAGQTHYCDSRGLPALRAAIVGRLRRDYDVAYDPAREVLVTAGGIHAYFCALSAILSPGDEVVVVDPAWMPHANLVELLGGRVVRVAGRPEDGFWPPVEAWSAAITARTVALVVNSPNNPTGKVAPRALLEGLNRLAERHGLYVISDEVYDKLLFDGRSHTCFAALPGASARTLLVNSLSKTYAMTGWRVGYLTAPAYVVEQALKAGQHTVTSLPPFVQAAAAFALEEESAAVAAREMLATYVRRRDLVRRIFHDRAGSSVGWLEPEGAFYILLDIRKLRRPSAQIAAQLLEEKRVAFVPGSVYGLAAEGFLRMTIAASDSDIDRGLTALLDWADQLSVR